jgi:hypothetical protein
MQLIEVLQHVVFSSKQFETIHIKTCNETLRLILCVNCLQVSLEISFQIETTHALGTGRFGAFESTIVFAVVVLAMSRSVMRTRGFEEVRALLQQVGLGEC